MGEKDERGTMTRKRIAVLVGSLRQGSFNRKMARTLIEVAPGSLDLEIVEIGALTLYDQDLDEDPTTVPAEWKKFRERLRGFDGFLFVTPEYNRGVPGVLKNAIDVGSRPPRESVWAGKPGAVMSVSTGALGGFGANHHLRQSLVFLDVPCMPQPEAYIGHAGDQFDEGGALTSEATREFVTGFMRAFARWVEVHS
jgi:chromate reductase, NAD(P)H dehydrogenase (quinone)